ncbi:hypothetical protein, partial [Zymobacter palmae]|uniref:hypothetical protein n=1 Tax=Zymobacter palmae TaxID=33074 RepID=UPI0005703BE9
TNPARVSKQLIESMSYLMLEMMIHFENLKHPHKLPDHLVKERLASGVCCSASGSTFYIF